jgi:hypothetical protein
LLIIRGERTNINSSVAARDILKRKTSRFETLVRYFEHLALLRVHPHGFDWYNIEEGRIEVFKGAIEEIATKDVETSRPF